MHRYQYSFSNETHIYSFDVIPYQLTISPAHFIAPDIPEELNVYLVDLIRKEKSGAVNFGQAIPHILKDFIDSNKNCALGYYPSSTDEKEAARVRLFSGWAEKINTDEITTVKNILKFPDGEILAICFYYHREYPKENELINYINSFSNSVSGK
jgi:hypothetical protein